MSALHFLCGSDKVITIAAFGNYFVVPRVGLRLIVGVNIVSKKPAMYSKAKEVSCALLYLPVKQLCSFRRAGCEIFFKKFFLFRVAFTE